MKIINISYHIIKIALIYLKENQYIEYILNIT